MDIEPTDGVGVVGSVFAIPRGNSNPIESVARSRSSRIALRDRVSVPLRHFIAGPENALTKLAAESVTNQWVRFNPVFISGPPGVGKSHLLHCLVEASKIEYADLRTLWLTGADYARAIATGVEVDSLDDVRDTHRSVDLLVLDGLHELAAKPLAQQELVHTIDGLLEQDAQILISSRVALGELHSLLPLLASRLSGGIQIPIAPPAAATRDAILTELAQQNDVVIPPQLIQRLTSDPTQQRTKPLLVNDLTAAITELRCFSETGDAQAACAVDRLGSQADQVHEVTVKEINKRVAKSFGVTVRELTGLSRRKTVVQARAMAIYLIRSLVGSSFQVIGQSFCGRDHTTISHAFQRAGKWLDTDARFARMVAEVRAAFE